MSVLENRLSLGRRQCAERRRYLAGLEALAQRLRADERRLRAEIELAATRPMSPEAGAGRPGVPGALVGELPGALAERHAKLAGSVAAIDTQIAEVGAALGAAEQELKRHELAAAQLTARAGLSERRRTRRAPVAPSPSAGPDHNN